MAESLFHRKLRVKIEDEQQKRVAFLIAGTPTDYANYREQVGYLQGLTDSLALCEQIDQENQ